MTENNTRVALIPAYEPESHLIDLLQNAQEKGLQTIVIDDGSGHSFSDIFEQAAEFAVVLTHRENRGKGWAIKTGLQYIREHYRRPYTVVTMDADGQHQVSDAVRICEAAERNPNALILGSRGLRENVPLRSRLGNTITRFVYKISTGLCIHDTQTGLRAFSGGLLPALLEISGERYEYEMNVLLEFAHKGIGIEETSISTIYFNNNSGSHFNTLKDSYRIYKEILKYSASSCISFLLDYAIYSLLTVSTGQLGSISLPFSNIAARIISATVNFMINRKLVFKSKESVWKSAVQYFTLAAVILAGNTFMLSVLAEQLKMNQFTAKLLTEMLFFVFSWLVQRFVIFRRRETAQ